MSIDLTNGPVTKKMMLFSLPLIAGNLLQQTYNIADTVIVGRFLGADALAAVGSSYALMTFLTSILLGLCMGSGALFSIRYGEKNEEKNNNIITGRESDDSWNSCSPVPEPEQQKSDPSLYGLFFNNRGRDHFG